MARSRISDVRVWQRARDYLGLMTEPAICLSVLGPSEPSEGHISPGVVDWSKGIQNVTLHAPFYILRDQEGQLHCSNFIYHIFTGRTLPVGLTCTFQTCHLSINFKF